MKAKEVTLTIKAVAPVVDGEYDEQVIVEHLEELVFNMRNDNFDVGANVHFVSVEDTEVDDGFFA